MGEHEQEKQLEELSALMDGEVSELELHRVMKQLEQDEGLSQKWARYQLSSAVMRKQTNGSASQWAQIDISKRVQQALVDEPLPTPIPAESKGFQWLKPFANVAVAASVSAAVILGWQNFNVGTSPSSPGSVAATNPGLSSSASSLAAAQPNSPFTTVSQGGAGNPSAYRVPEGEIIRYSAANDKHINDYLLSHSGNAAMSTATSMEPYVRMVSAQSQQAPAER